LIGEVWFQGKGSQRHEGVLAVRHLRIFEFRPSDRIDMTIPIEVCGTKKGVLFSETANTLIVNAHGVLISVTIPLLGQGVGLPTLGAWKRSPVK
jgi:hypothetical protein